MDHFLDKSHGQPGFSASAPPALRIVPGTGERIGFETSDAVYAELHEHHDMSKLTAQINPVTGPVWVEGAKPGDALRVTIHEIRLKDYGWSVSIPGSGALHPNDRGTAFMASLVAAAVTKAIPAKVAAPASTAASPAPWIAAAAVIALLAVALVLLRRRRRGSAEGP